MQNSKVWVIAYFMKKVLNLSHFSRFPFFRFRFQLAAGVGGSFMIQKVYSEMKWNSNLHQKILIRLRPQSFSNKEGF